MNAIISAPATLTYKRYTTRGFRRPTARYAGALFTLALKKVESKSIQKWARDQRSIWIKLIQKNPSLLGYRVFDEPTDEGKADRITALIVATAIGL